jgi:hypothetical protein
MPKPADARHWSRFFIHRTDHVRTTWKLRIAVVLLIVFGAWLTRYWWTVAVGNSLVCSENVAPSDAILVENFDAEYLLFERAARLRRAGLAPRVLVPVAVDADLKEVNRVAKGIAGVMAEISRLGEMEIIPTRSVEPISLNAALDVLRFARQSNVRSIIIVAPLFRSRRSALIYESTLGRAGITVRCDPVHGTRDVDTWDKSLHGIQNVIEQWLKLQYYRFYVLPFWDRHTIDAPDHPNSDVR